MNQQLESILEQSVSQIAAGRARIESCLLSYPAMAEDLEPLLRTAEKLRGMPKPELSPEARARIEGRVLEAAAARPALRPARTRKWGLAWPGRRWVFGALAAVLVFSLLLVIVVPASADALPGSALYPVKLAAEGVSLWLAPASEEPGLHLGYARRRLVEFTALAERGVFEESVLQAMEAHIQAALAGAEELPAEQALPVLDGLAELIADEQQALSLMLEDAPVAARPLIEEALADSVSHLSRIDTLRGALRPSGPAPPPTTEPALPVPPGTMEATPTPTQTMTATPSPTPTRTQTPSPTATQYEAPSSGDPSGPSPTPTNTRPPGLGLTKTAEPQRPTPKPSKTPKPGTEGEGKAPKPGTEGEGKKP